MRDDSSPILLVLAALSRKVGVRGDTVVATVAQRVLTACPQGNVRIVPGGSRPTGHWRFAISAVRNDLAAVGNSQLR